MVAVLAATLGHFRGLSILEDACACAVGVLEAAAAGALRDGFLQLCAHAHF